MRAAKRHKPSSSTSSGGEIKQVAAAALPRIDATMSTREAFMMSNRQDGARRTRIAKTAVQGAEARHRATSTASVEMTTNVVGCASAPSPAEPSHENCSRCRRICCRRNNRCSRNRSRSSRTNRRLIRNRRPWAAGSLQPCHDWCRSYRRDAAWGGAGQGCSRNTRRVCKSVSWLSISCMRRPPTRRVRHRSRGGARRAAGRAELFTADGVRFRCRGASRRQFACGDGKAGP